MTFKRSNIFFWFAYQWYYWWIVIEKYYFISRGWIKMGWFASWVWGNSDHEWPTDWIQRLVSNILPKKTIFPNSKNFVFFNQEKSSSAIKMQKLLIATYCLELKIFILILNHINFILSNRKGVVSMTSLPLLISILTQTNVSNHYPKLNFDIVLMDLVHGPIRIVYPIRWSKKLLLDVQILMGEEFQF